jgi:hypothetical protein
VLLGATGCDAGGVDKPSRSADALFTVAACKQRHNLLNNISQMSNENFKTTNPSHNKDRPKTTREREMF